MKASNGSGKGKSSAHIGPALAVPATTLPDYIQLIQDQMESPLVQVEAVEKSCVELLDQLLALSVSERLEYLVRLAMLLRGRVGRAATIIFDLIERATPPGGLSWNVLEELLAAKDPQLVQRTLVTLLSLVEAGTLLIDQKMALQVAELVEANDVLLSHPQLLQVMERILRLISKHEGRVDDPILDFYLSTPGIALQRLAARILDSGGGCPSDEVAAHLLGEEAYAILRPYIEYTRATYLDLLFLADGPVPPKEIALSLCRAESICGETLLREAIAELGWPRLNLGMEAQRWAGISVDGSFPLLMPEAIARMFDSSSEIRRVIDCFLFVAHGALLRTEKSSSHAGDVVGLFRSYNLAHAAALGDILDVSPLTKDKVKRILQRMDRIVSDFVRLFSSTFEGCELLTELYQNLKSRVEAELQKTESQLQLSAELTSLVQTFEDPKSLSEVKTLHGLKRFLHQEGLRLGMRLVEVTPNANRSVSLLLKSQKRAGWECKTVQYVDFEPAEEGMDRARIPYPVRALVEALGRELIQGNERFPETKIFCYGNEVHYYLSFRNHPAFLRIDFSPPLQGGMIDLEYFGVSKYELSAHPNPTLDFLRLLFRRLEFDIEITDTRVHARYDKERALTLDDINQKAHALFRLVPYLMEVDWVIGDLGLSIESRQKVAQAWAEFFVRWDTLPMNHVLSADRRSIVTGVESGPTGEREIIWSGEGSYRDKFRPLTASALSAHWQPDAAVPGEGFNVPVDGGNSQLVGQEYFEHFVVRPMVNALRSGELIETSEGLRINSPDLFQHRHEAEIFAEILSGDMERLHAGIHLAQVVAPLERTLYFHTTGELEGFEVQRAHLPLPGQACELYGLRDSSGLIRIAFFAMDSILFDRRLKRTDSWQPNWSCQAATLLPRLWQTSYIMPGIEIAPACSAEITQSVRDEFRPRQVEGEQPRLRLERMVQGLRASPGRSVGRALFGTSGRRPEHFDGAILVTPSLRPEDNAFLYHAAGVVSTGGGVLSHAGLMATQFGKPALIIHGRWEQSNHSHSVIYWTNEYTEEERKACGYCLVIRHNIHQREHVLSEGDLLVVDANRGFLTVLGQSREALGIHEGFHLLSETNRRLKQTNDEKESLMLRGRRLRARHQIEKLLRQLDDPTLVCHVVYEILMGGALAADVVGAEEKGRLLSIVLSNPRTGSLARQYLSLIREELEVRYEALAKKAWARTPTSSSLYEILVLRLDLMHARGSIQETNLSLTRCGFGRSIAGFDRAEELEKLFCLQVGELQKGCGLEIERHGSVQPLHPRMRHLLRQQDRVNLVLGGSGKLDPGVDVIRSALGMADQENFRRHANRFVLSSSDCGFELAPLIGWKAANLGEVLRLGGERSVPPFFVVTHRAFLEMLAAPRISPKAANENFASGCSTLREAITTVQGQKELSSAQKSSFIRRLWNAVEIPDLLKEEALSFYRQLEMGATPGEGCPNTDVGGLFVAVRSSAREEDAEAGARAGEFETILFVRGETPLLESLKRAWSGLWTERAIHNREVFGTGTEQIGGGIIVQQMVWARVSGVLQTVKVAEAEPREMIVNAGLGLGEGVVSGRVGADQVSVSKEGDLLKDALRFHYVTSNKLTRVVFNKPAGTGTVLVETLYHQRLRPALEYVELVELVRTARRLEMAYGYPLDLEFAIEGNHVWIVQVRPVPTFLATLHETLGFFPLGKGGRNLSNVPVSG